MCLWLGLSEKSTDIITASVKRLESVQLVEVVRQHAPKDPWSITLSLDSEKKYDQLLQDYIDEVNNPSIVTACENTTQYTLLDKENILYKGDIEPKKHNLLKNSTLGEIEWKDID